MSIPTCMALAHGLERAQRSAPPAWLQWFAVPRDPPLLVLLVLVALAFGLGRAARRP